MRTLSIVGALVATALFLPFLASNALARPAAPVLGPGAVIEMHKSLLAAIDRGDAEKAASFVDAKGGDVKSSAFAKPSLFLIDAHGLPVAARDLTDSRNAIAELAKASKDGGPEWSSKIVSVQADCGTPELSCVVLEFERTSGVEGGERRYLSTSVVRWTNDGFKLVHWHVSPANGDTARAVLASR
jgi:hypothetical protein